MCRVSDCYDASFAKEIKKIAPHWFVTQSDLANKKKEALLKLARKGGKKPAPKTVLYSPLNNYIRKSNACYDASFAKDIKKLAPHWFENSADKKKKELLKLARKGKERPKHKTSLGLSFFNYIKETNDCYDESFTKKIKIISPHWFATPSDVANKKKEALLKLAKKGGKRPHQKTNPLGSAICTYTSIKSISYDPTFTKQIKELAPHWFMGRSGLANQKKKDLLKLAKSGEKPHWKSFLGRPMHSYMSKSHGCYDPAFTKKIKKIAPHWFKT